MSPRAKKLLRLALCPTAPDGEILAAVRALQRLAADIGGDPINALLVGPATIPDCKLPWGKYRGRLVSEVVAEDYDYVAWLDLNVAKKTPRLAAAVAFWLTHSEAA